MKNTIPILSLIAVLLAIAACTARIDIDTEDAEPRLSIFGYLTNEPKMHSIRISSTNGYFNENRPPVITGAKVTISYDNRVVHLVEGYENPGVYDTPDNFRAEEGKTYTLDVELDFNNDGIKERYQAVTHMPYSAQVDSVKLEPSKLTSVPNLLLYGRVPTNQTNELGLYIQRNSEPLHLFDYFLILPDWYFMGFDIRGYEFPCYVQDGIVAGDTITFSVNLYTEDFATFLSHANSASSGSNPIFGGPPSDVKTNIVALDEDNDVQVAGYFSAFPISAASTVSDRDYQ